VPENRLVWTVADAVEEMDLSALYPRLPAQTATAARPDEPSMVALLRCA